MKQGGKCHKRDVIKTAQGGRGSQQEGHPEGRRDLPRGRPMNVCSMFGAVQYVQSTEVAGG